MKSILNLKKITYGTSVFKFLLALTVCIFIIIGGVLFLRMHNGVRIKPSEAYAIADGIIFYRQDDAAWCEDYLGESSYTMKSSGCLVACIAAAVSAGDAYITPGELNAFFSDNNVYDDEGNLQWFTLADLDGYFVNVYDDVSEKEIEQCLSDGRYPIVRVRMHGAGNYHYVLIVGTEDEEYVCMDPLKNDLTKLSDYWDYVYAVRCVWKEQDR